MSPLSRCSECGGFVPPSAALCPHCDRGLTPSGWRLGRAASACLKVATGSAVAVTLMACYGGPPHSYGPPPQPPEPCSTDPNTGQPTDPGCAPSNQPLEPAQQAPGADPAFAQPPPTNHPGS
ncbi:MAG: hypothetical protein HYZ29_06415 [Myxococcales bacterium]|nr:hypothetical protein [Myxococcales bacterium]